MMKHSTLAMILSVLMVLVAACFSAPEDPCAKKADSVACRLVSAQVEATLGAQNMTAQAQLTQVSIEQTRTADEVTRAASQATVTAQAKATDEDYQRRAALLGLTATAQALDDAQAERTRQALVVIASATSRAQAQATTDMRMQQAYEFSGTLQAGNATATMVIQRTRDAIAANEMQAEANRKATEAWTAGIVTLVVTAVGLVLLVAITIGIILLGFRGGRKLLEIIKHWLTVRSSTVRSSKDPNAIDAPYFVFPPDSKYQVLDTDHIVGAQMLSDGSNQPTTDPAMADHIQEAWIALLSNATRDQLVKLYQRATSEIGGEAQAALPEPGPDERPSEAQWTVVSPDSPEIRTWLDEVEQRLLLENGGVQ